MNILMQSDGEAWMASKQYDVIPCRPWRDADGTPQQGNEGFVEIDEHWHVTSFELMVQTDGRTQVQLADRIARWFDTSIVLLWMTGGTYPEESDVALLLKALHRLGVAGETLYNHYFSFDLARDEDGSVLERLLLLMMAFNQEGFVLAENGKSMVWMADEIIKLATNQPEGFNEAQKIVADLELKALQPDFYWGTHQRS